MYRVTTSTAPHRWHSRDTTPGSGRRIGPRCGRRLHTDHLGCDRLAVFADEEVVPRDCADEVCRPKGLSRTALLGHLRPSAPNFTDKSPDGWTHRVVEGVFYILRAARRSPMGALPTHLISSLRRDAAARFALATGCVELGLGSSRSSNRLP